MDIREPRIRIAPSILSADFAQLRDHIALVEAGGADILHLDVMDGHFVPNISFGVPVVEKIRAVSNLFFDTHVMITNPYQYAEPFIKAGSNNYTFHIEADDLAERLVDHVHELGAGVGVALNPTTPGEVIDTILPRVDLVLVMSVWPGFGGQAFMPQVLPKAADLRRKLRSDQRLEIDGGIDAQTAGQAAASGADTFVAGSAIFGASDPVAAMERIRAEARRNWGGYPGPD